MEITNKNCFVYYANDITNSWASSFASTASDRTCIASNGNRRVKLSTNDPLSCCRSCGLGCRGGELPGVWSYWINNGVVSGGEYNDSDAHMNYNSGNKTFTCWPYYFRSCQHSGDGNRSSCADESSETPSCRNTCV